MEKIGEYLVKRLIGEGGMGKVYEAEERLSKRRVALKVLRPELTRSEDGRRLFLNEMQILAHLEHPNVVRSLASMEVDGQLVMALEYLDGRTLRRELTDRGTLPWHEAVEIVVKIADALNVAHSQEPAIVHRDLKPENVMLIGTDGLKVMDFGIAKVLEAVHATNTQSIGTLQYMSPEQIDARTIDPRSDLYSLGLIFYEMLAGSPPFHSASPRELLNMQCTTPPPPLADEVRRGLPRGVEEVLFALLEKRPDDRPAVASDVTDRLSPLPGVRSCTTSEDVGNAQAPAQQWRRFEWRARLTPNGANGTGGNDVNANVRPLGQVAQAGQGTGVRSGDTLPSDGSGRGRDRERKEVPRTDTIALVEKGTAPREVSTLVALLVIVALSLVAGLTTYVIRARTAGSDTPGTTTASAARTPLR